MPTAILRYENYLLNKEANYPTHYCTLHNLLQQHHQVAQRRFGALVQSPSHNMGGVSAIG